MTDIEQKALVLLNDVRTERGFAPVGGLYGSVLLGEALCRAIEQIEQHEAFRQEVSDAVAFALKVYAGHSGVLDPLKRFVIPKRKPDPLVDAMADCGVDRFESWADQLRAALEARGFEIREKGE